MKLLTGAIRSICELRWAARPRRNAARAVRLQGPEPTRATGPNASVASRFPCERSCYNRITPNLKRAFSRFIGVDLGGGRGKTTAIAEIRSGASGAQVVEVATRSGRM